MGKFYDIRNKLDNTKSSVQIDDEHVYKINASKAAGMAINSLNKNKDLDEFQKIDKIIKISLGEEALKYIDSLKLDIPNYTPIVNTIMAALNGKELEEIEEMSKEAENKAKKK